MEIIHQDTVTKLLTEDIKTEAKLVKVPDSQNSGLSYSCMPANCEAGFEQPLVMQESYMEMVRVDPKLDSVEETMSQGSFTISSISNSDHQVECLENMRDDIEKSELQLSLESIGDSHKFEGDFVAPEGTGISQPESSDEEQLLFGDLDDLKHSEVQSLHVVSLDPVEKEICPSLILDNSEVIDDSFDTNYESNSSRDSFIQENPSKDLDDLVDTSRLVSSPISIPSSIKVTGEEVERLAESLPNMGPHGDDLDAHKLLNTISHSLDSTSKSLGWALLRNNISTFTKSAAENEHILAEQCPIEDTQISKELINVLSDPSVGKRN